MALRDVKEWGSADKASWYQRHTAATLRNEVLAVYALREPEKATSLQRESQAAAKATTTNSPETSLKSKYWYTQFSDRRAIADEAVKIALSLVESDPEKALRLVVQSLQGGIVSGVLFDIVQELIENRNRAYLDKIQIGISQVLAANVTLAPSSLTRTAILVLADKDMPSAARNTLVRFFMHPLQACSILIKEPGIDTFYVSAVFSALSGDVRPILVRYSPDQLLMFDLILSQLASLVPEKTKSRIEAFQLEAFSDPRDRLNDILKDPAPAKRDLRLVRLVSELLRNESGDFQKNIDLASDAISGFSDMGCQVSLHRSLNDYSHGRAREAEEVH